MKNDGNGKGQVTGLIWLDHPDTDDGETVQNCIERAARAYFRKWHIRPEYIRVNPATLGKPSYRDKKLAVEADPLVLPCEYWVGPAPRRET